MGALSAVRLQRKLFIKRCMWTLKNGLHSALFSEAATRVPSSPFLLQI